MLLTSVGGWLLTTLIVRGLTSEATRQVLNRQFDPMRSMGSSGFKPNAGAIPKNCVRTIIL